MRKSASVSGPEFQIIDRNTSARNQLTSLGRLKLRAQELSIVGLPIYDAKRKLVEKVCLRVVLRFFFWNRDTSFVALITLMKYV